MVLGGAAPEARKRGPARRICASHFGWHTCRWNRYSARCHQADRDTARLIDMLARPVEVMLRAHRVGALALAGRSPCERANRQEEGFNADK